MNSVSLQTSAVITPHPSAVACDSQGCIFGNWSAFTSQTQEFDPKPSASEPSTFNSRSQTMWRPYSSLLNKTEFFWKTN